MIKRKRRTVTDLDEPVRFTRLRDECDKIVLAGGKYEKISVLAQDIQVGDQFQPDSQSVVQTYNMKSHYPFIRLSDGCTTAYRKDERVFVFRATDSFSQQVADNVGCDIADVHECTFPPSLANVSEPEPCTHPQVRYNSFTDI